MGITDKERGIISTALHRFLNLKEPTPHKLLLRQCKDPDAIQHLMRGVVLSTFGDPPSYLPKVLAFHYSGDAEELRRAKYSVTTTIKVLQNLFDVELEKENFSFDDVQEHARKIYDIPPSTDEIQLGLFLVAEFANVLKGCTLDASHIQVKSLQLSDNIVALKDIDGMWERHVHQYQQYLEKGPESFSFEEAFDAEPLGLGNEQSTATHRGLLVFVSHSSKDAELALALVDLLRASLGLLADQIRCSSVDGYRLPIGVNTEGRLREEVNATKVVIGLITPSSLNSYYVMFELGARWGSNRFLAPLLAGVKGEELKEPLRLLNALSAENESQLHQLLNDVSKQVGAAVQSPASYLREVAAVRKLAGAVTSQLGKVAQVAFGPPEREPINVEFTPWQVQGERMFLTVTNRGSKQVFHAQCRILARRNDPNPSPVMLLNLEWEDGNKHNALVKGESANLLIASAGEDRAQEMEWMKLESDGGRHAPDSRWHRGEKRKPEYDLEIILLGDMSAQPKCENFTVRPGANCALEMYRRYLYVESPENETVADRREYLVKGSVGIPRANVQLWVQAGGMWHPQGDAVVKGRSWERMCCFGNKESLKGEYIVVAVADGDIEPRKYKELPERGLRSAQVRVHLNRAVAT